jgi:glycogen debranching enzyme
MSLDGHKRQQAVISSNAGHLLWSRLINKERARLVAHRLMKEDMFSGWGIRTLSASEPTFNPLSYHRGSVWPHDNSLCAQGFAFFDLKQPLARVLTGLFQAAARFRNLRLPELFVGAQRREFDEPVHYPVSCSPQAWASGAWFLLLTSILGLRPNASRRELRIVNPMLPDWLTWFRIRNLQIGNAQVSLEFSRRDQRTFCNVLDVQGDRLAISVDFTK